MDNHLIQLNCNVHPLVDGVARQVKTNLSQLDQRHSVKGNCFGKEGTATNLINAVSILRYKAGTGDPTGFKNFLRENGLPVGTFVRYVGNRIHVVFHLAGLLILHWARLKSYVDQKCNAAVALRNSVRADLSNECIISQVWAMAVLGKVFSGPWMTKFYSNKSSNLEMVHLIQLCVHQLKAWQSDASPLLQPSTDVFGNDLTRTDPVLSSLQEHVDGDQSFKLEALSAVISGSVSVLERQLGNFLGDGDLSAPSESLMEATASAPSHNMASERALGCLDKMWRHAPNATLGFLNGKVRFKMNKVMGWVEGKEEEERCRLIGFAIGEANDKRAVEVLKRQKLLDEIGERRNQVSLDRQKVSKKKLIKGIAAALCLNSVSDLSVSESLGRKIESFMNDSSSYIGTLLMHSFDGVECYGRIHNVVRGKTKKSCSNFEIGYWSLSESESNSVDKLIAVSSFFAEVSFGNVVFL